MTQGLELVDIGANLTHDSFDSDRSDVIRAALDAGVHQMIITGASVEGSQEACELSAQWPNQLWATAGVHPHHAKDWHQEADQTLRQIAKNDCIVAAGECGLDYYRNFSSPQQQKIAFEAQLTIAVDFNLPVFLHQREAIDPFLEILEPFLHHIPRAVAHCFTDHKSELRKLLDNDLFIGITGWICDERRGHHLRDLIRYIPSNRLMIETDAPYLLPRDLRPKPKSRRNIPANLPHIAACVARSANKPLSQLASETTAAARQFFNLVPPEIQH